MQRRNALTLMSLAALGVTLPSAVAAETLHVVETNDGYLNLRAGPGTGYGIVARMTAGMAVDGLARQGNWRQLVLPDGTIGWAYRDYLAGRFIPVRSYDYRVVPTNDGYLNLRNGPGTGYRILRRLYAGQRLFALDASGS